MSFIKKLAKFVLQILQYNLKRLLFFFTGNKKYGKFIVLTRSRTGSTYLNQLLDSHPNISTLDEPYRIKFIQTSFMIWNRVFSSKPKQIEQVGFKLMYYHDLNVNNSVWDILKNNLDVKIIHLQRHNLLRCLISRELAVKMKAFHSHEIDGNRNILKKKVFINPDKIIRDLELTETSKIKALKLLENHQIIELYYEDFCNNTTKLNEVLQFLNLPSVELKSSLKKMNPEPLEDLVSNYSDIYNRLRNTKWSYLLDLP